MYEAQWNADGSQFYLEAAIPRGQPITIHFKTPPTIGNGGGYISVIEHQNAFGGPVPCQRQGALNTTPGDLTTDLGDPNTLTSSRFRTMEPRIEFRGAEVIAHGAPQPALLLKGSTDYYLNIENVPGQEQSGVAAFGIQFLLTPTKNK